MIEHVIVLVRMKFHELIQVPESRCWWRHLAVNVIAVYNFYDIEPLTAPTRAPPIEQ